MKTIALTAAAVCAGGEFARRRMESLAPENLPREYYCGRVKLERVYNPGMLYGAGSEKKRLLRWLPALLLGGISALVFSLRGRLHPWEKVGAGLLLGGGLSNYFERTRFGRVLDYLNLPKVPGKQLRQTVFNLADVAIVLGTVLFLPRALRTGR